MVWKKVCKKQSNGQLMRVRLPGGLEPQSGAVRLEPHKAEARARVVLPEVPCEAHAELCSLLVRPAEEFLKPARLCERPGFFSVGVRSNLRQRITDGGGVLGAAVICGDVGRNPTGPGWRRLVLFHAL